MKSDEIELKSIEDWNGEYIFELKNKYIRENTRLEFKSGKWLEDKDIAYNLRAYISAMENSSGGFLVIGIEGIDDNTKIDRIKDIDGINNFKSKLPIEEWVRRVISDSIIPSLHPFPKIKIVPISSLNKEVIVIQVFPTYANLHYVWYNGEEHYWFRNGPDTLEMDKWLSRALIQGRIPSPIFRIECNYQNYQNQNIILRLINEGFSSGKNIQLMIIHSSNVTIDKIITHNPNTTIDNIGDIKFRTLSLKDIPSQLKDIFELDTTTLATRIYDSQILHPIDFKEYIFKLTIIDTRKTIHELIDPTKSKKSGIIYPAPNATIGIIIFSDNSRPKYFGIEFWCSNVGIDPKIINYTENNKIKIQ